MIDTSRFLALSFAAVVLATPALAGVECHTLTLNTPQLTNWIEPVSVPRFDPNLGQLRAITCTITGRTMGSAGVESPTPMPGTIVTTFSASVYLARPGGALLVSALPTATFTDNVSAYDGVIDFGGTSGFWHFGIEATATSSATTSAASDLAFFTGGAGSPGSAALDAGAIGLSSVVGSGGIISLFQQWAAAPVVEVCYEYDSPGIVICSGDGTGTACPCGNFGAQLHGCASSVSAAGALLGAIGSASLANDTVVLTCGGMRPSSTCLYFQGTQLIALGAGEMFGDGLRCAGGTITRLATKTNASGSSRYPEAGDAPVSVRGAVSSIGGPYVYQVWYRNAGAFCTPSTFNLSNGLVIGWSQ